MLKINSAILSVLSLSVLAPQLSVAQQLSANDHPVHKCLRGAIQGTYDKMITNSWQSTSINEGDITHYRLSKVFQGLDTVYSTGRAGSEGVERDLSKKADLFVLPIEGELKRADQSAVIQVQGCAIVAVASEGYDDMIGINSGFKCGVRSAPLISGLNLMSVKTGKALVGDPALCEKGQKNLEDALRNRNQRYAEYLHYFESTQDLADYSEYTASLPLVEKVEEKKVKQEKPETKVDPKPRADSASVGKITQAAPTSRGNLSGSRIN